MLDRGVGIAHSRSLVLIRGEGVYVTAVERVGGPLIEVR